MTSSSSSVAWLLCGCLSPSVLVFVVVAGLITQRAHSLRFRYFTTRQIQILVELPAEAWDPSKWSPRRSWSWLAFQVTALTLLTMELVNYLVCGCCLGQLMHAINFWSLNIDPKHLIRVCSSFVCLGYSGPYGKIYQRLLQLYIKNDTINLFIKLHFL